MAGKPNTTATAAVRFCLLLGCLLLASNAAAASDASQGPSPYSTSPSPAADAAAPTNATNFTEVVSSVRRAMLEPKPQMLILRQELESEGSTISTGESYDGDVLIVQVGDGGGGDDMHDQACMISVQNAAGY